MSATTANGVSSNVFVELCRLISVEIRSYTAQMALEISLAWEIDQSNKKHGEQNGVAAAVEGELKNCVTPGTSLSVDSGGFMRGHGTHLDGEGLVASVAGVIERVNKLICVKPLKSRYNGEIGDVVIGRITEVQQKRWKVETNGRLDSVLLLSSVNLPGGELRRKSQEDELMMRQYLREGDLISAEVQIVFHDGSLSLHTRSLKYGKLGQGILVKVSPSLVKRRKTHFHNLPCGASIILGCNGYIWISPTINEDDSNTGGFIQNLEMIARQERDVIVRLRNCVSLLASHRVMLYDTTVQYAYEASRLYEIKEMLKHEIGWEIAEQTRNRIARDEGASLRP